MPGKIEANKYILMQQHTKIINTYQAESKASVGETLFALFPSTNGSVKILMALSDDCGFLGGGGAGSSSVSLVCAFGSPFSVGSKSSVFSRAALDFFGGIILFSLMVCVYPEEERNKL